MNRKQRRAHQRQQKNNSNQELSEKMSMFESLPDECLACLKPFDKKNKEMVTTWSVVVREEQSVVRLYCPECWDNAISTVQTYNQKIKEE